MVFFNRENDKWFLKQVNLGILKVSKKGVVINTITGNTIGALSSNGYFKISMLDKANNKTRHMQVNRLVYMVFVGTIPKNCVIDHIDENKTNNYYKNLQPLTSTANLEKSVKHNIGNSKKAEDKINSKFSNAQVVRFRKLYYKGKINVKYIQDLTGAHKITVSYMLTGKTYSSVGGPICSIRNEDSGRDDKDRKSARTRREPTIDELKKIIKMRSKGLSDYTISERLGISRPMLFRWRKTYEVS